MGFDSEGEGREKNGRQKRWGSKKREIKINRDK
jgi:hypothetical protein